MKRFAVLLLLFFPVLMLSDSARAEKSVSLCPAVGDPRAIPPEFRFIQDMKAGAEGWIFSRRDTGRVPPLDPATQQALGLLVQRLAGQGTQLVLTLVPNRIFMSAPFATPAIRALAQYVPGESEAAFATRLKQVAATGALAPDVLASWKAAPPLDPVFFKRDHHWTPLGAARTARVVAEALAPVPAFRALVPEHFATYPAGEEAYAGYYARLITRVCGSTVPTERLALYASTATPDSRAHAPDKALDLLGDAPRPRIVLAGTSFSNNEGKDRFNFAGFLRQALRQDVLSVAVAGGGSGGSMLAWLAGGQQEKTRPAFLIWEMPGEYDLNNPPLLRQLVGAAGGVCAAPRTLAEARVQAVPGKPFPVLQIPPGRKVVGLRDYVVLETEDRALTRFNVLFGYASGKTETFRVERSGRGMWTGRTFISLDPRYGDDLRDVRVQTAEAVRGALTARLCQGGEGTPAP